MDEHVPRAPLVGEAGAVLDVDAEPCSPRSLGDEVRTKLWRRVVEAAPEHVTAWFPMTSIRHQVQHGQ